MQKSFFFLEDVEGSFFVCNFFSIECRRHGLDYISCKYEEATKLIYWLFGLA
jgi:hypothetical protein